MRKERWGWLSISFFALVIERNNEGERRGMGQEEKREQSTPAFLLNSPSFPFEGREGGSESHGRGVGRGMKEGKGKKKYDTLESDASQYRSADSSKKKKRKKRERTSVGVFRNPPLILKSRPDRPR